MGASNVLLGCLNSITLCISLPIILAGYLLKITLDFPCAPILYKPLLDLGLFLFIISLIGLFGACCRINLLLWLYMIALFVIIVGLLACLSFGGVVVRGGDEGEEVVDGVKEYELSTFSEWLQDNLVGGNRWEDIKTCMVIHDACTKIYAFRTIMDFVTLKRSKLSPIETGCCKPPVHCGYEYESSTNWRVPAKGLKSEDEDCTKWNNEPDKLCYNCGSCKAGYLALFIQGWRKFATVNSIVLAVLLVIFFLACCALRH